jgi:hypothetical protein
MSSKPLMLMDPGLRALLKLEQKREPPEDAISRVWSRFSGATPRMGGGGGDGAAGRSPPLHVRLVTLRWLRNSDASND